MSKNMNKRKHRFPIERSELERRWKLIRAEMECQGITLMMACSNHPLQQGYSRYLCGVYMDPAHISPVFALLPLDGDAYYVCCGSPSDLFARPFEAGVQATLSDIYYRTVGFTNTRDAEIIAGIIRKRKDKKVGIAGRYNFNYIMMQYLRENCPNVEWIDCTDIIDNFMTVKSAYEQELVRASARIHDHIMEAIPALFHPGIFEYELKGYIDKMMTDMGSENRLIIIGSSKVGVEPPTYAFAPYLGRQLNTGDQVYVMVESSGPGGYFTESGRTFVFGQEPDDDTVKASALSTEVQHYIASIIRPGMTAQEIRKLVDEKRVSHGQSPETRIDIHGQGYNIMERPVLIKGENFVVKTGMNLAIHPTIVIGNSFGFMVDNFLIGENGCELMMKNQQKAIRI